MKDQPKHRPSEIAGIKVRWPEDEEIQQLRKQLAAERESEGKLRVLLATELERRQAAEQQLAAERAKLADAEILCSELQRNRDEIHQQLAKVREGK